MKQNVIDIDSKQLLCDAQQNWDKPIDDHLVNSRLINEYLNVIADKCAQVVGKLKALFGLKYAV